jgi:S-adenosylmethionine decarboxylase proenzyme
MKMQTTNKILGISLELDIVKCDEKIIGDVEKVRKIMLEIANEIKVKIVSSDFMQFNPYGVSGVIVIAESHIAVHTWKEYRFVSIDLYTCDLKIDLDKAVKLFKKKFKGIVKNKRITKRGF